MPVARVHHGGLCVAAVAVVLLAGASGCAKGGGGDPKAAAPPASSSVPTAAPSEPVSATATPTAAVTAAGAPPAASAATPSAPAAPTRLTVAVDTRGGRLTLVRGGAAQEFTVTLRNGNSADYRHLLVAFQMEVLVGEPGDRRGGGAGPGSGFLLERFDRASGTWRPAELRVANDAGPLSQYAGGGPLARDAVRVERYRLRATADGPTGSTPVVVSFVDTDTDREAAAHVLLGHSTG
ncbi:hypothetical protein ABTX80_06930 [Streptomyces erythrochromogenes]|uniref:hypothetical protein n=1 Tax=Streptomyces erythrochromogenes TaxID=285574 RepID=UPI0033190241